MGAYTGTVPPLLAGDIPAATTWQEVTNFMTATATNWTLAAPTWTATAGTPAIGNGTLTGRSRRIGQTNDFSINLVAGSTTTFGTAGAAFRFTIPGVPGGSGAAFYFGSGFVKLGGVERPLMWRIDTGLTTIRLFRISTEAELLNNSPAVMTNGDQIALSGTIELQ